MFVALLVGLFDPATGRIHLASAGQPPPYRLVIAGGPAAAPNSGRTKAGI